MSNATSVRIVGVAIVLAGSAFGFLSASAQSASTLLETLAYLLIGGCLVADPKYFLSKLALDEGLASYESAVPVPYLSVLAITCLLVSYFV